MTDVLHTAVEKHLCALFHFMCSTVKISVVLNCAVCIEFIVIFIRC